MSRDATRPEPSPAIDSATFIIGGGETGALVRAMDWGSSRLGPASSWPQSLRTALGLCLSSRFPIALYWGPEFVMLYNDDLRPMVGANKHPQAMGRPVFEVAPEIRGLIEPLLRQVVETGEGIWSEDLMLPLLRHEVPEESYFTFSYSPIRDESGAVGGVFCAVTETTDRLIEGRRLRLLNALAEASQAKTPAEACAVIAAQIARAPADLPFALFYLLDDSSHTATLAGAANLDPDDADAPASIGIGDDSIWPLGAVLAADAPREVIFASVRNGARGATILPFHCTGGARPQGFIIAGLSPMLRSSDSYARFHNLLAASVAQGVGNAAAYEAARQMLKREQVTRDNLYRHFMQAPFPVCVLRGPDHVIELANPQVLRAWGMTAEIVDKPLLQAIPQLHDQPFIGYLDEVYRTGVPYEGRAELARLPLGPNGELEDVYFNFVYAPLHDPDGAIEGVLVSAFTVTEIVLARRESDRARQEAEAAAHTQRHVREFQERFVAVLGHDLLNPLAAIAIGVGLLRRMPVNPPTSRTLDRIASSTRRMSRMVEQILDLSRARIGGGIEIAPAPMDLHGMLTAIVDELRASHPSHTFEVRGSSVLGTWDRDRLEQVFSNLFSNAIHHGLASAPITITVSQDGEHAHVDVHNDGPPIPDAIRLMLFDPFRRGDSNVPTTKSSGLGLGLFISRELIGAHGGELGVHSTAEAGTTFRVTLPRTVPILQAKENTP